MIFMLADGAVYTAHQWLVHEAALACVDPTMRPCLCELMTVYHDAGKSMDLAWEHSNERLLTYVQS